MVCGINHVGFAVTDVARSISFYEALLGVPPTSRRVYREQFVADVVGFPEVELDVAFFDVPGSSVGLELLEYRHPPHGQVNMETFNAGNGHVCVVVDDLASEFERLSRAQVVFRHDGPVEITFGAYAGGKALYLRDPDNISVELLELPK